jgi:hypothetical protein
MYNGDKIHIMYNGKIFRIIHNLDRIIHNLAQIIYNLSQII